MRLPRAQAICLGRPEDLTVRKEAKLLAVPPVSEGCDRDGLHLIMQNEGYQVATHTSCTCNELRALTERHLITRGTKFDLPYFRKQCFDVEVPFVEPIGKLEFIKHYSGAKRRSYANAYHTLQQVVSYDAISRIKMFVKPDKYPRGEIVSKAPRAIQYRAPEFNMLVGRFLKPYEEAYYSSTNSPIGLRMIAKGMNNHQRAANIVEASTYFSNPVYLLLDHSKFDSCVNEYFLKWEHRQYNKQFKNGFLRFLLSKCIVNRCKSVNGVKYQVKGTRMSGDYATALGNCLVNHLLLSSWLKNIKHHILLDGDDSVVICERDDLLSLMQTFGHFARMGFDTKCDIVYDINDVEFCRARLFPIDPPIFARPYERVLAHWNVANHHVDDSMLARHCAGLGLGELACNAGVPILGPLSRALANILPKGKTPLLQDKYKYAYGEVIGDETVTDEARETYHQVFGITPEDQKIIESNFTPPRVDDPRVYLNLLEHYESLQWQAE